MNEKREPAARPEDVGGAFAAFLRNTRYEDLPADAVAATKRSIFDKVGVMLAGSGPQATSHRLVGMLEQWGGEPTRAHRATWRWRCWSSSTPRR